ncbi:hypothetical protein MVEN_02585600 [Mycena venus]|uniref:Ribosomal L1 domain-containing protein 1 n=1 Tax=Mycena venus TaxID=2733690 RepID=A0A8H6U1Q7_9AGAR|nr:hypothetical protein MVEN_02585600 [Mycena venus]
MRGVLHSPTVNERVAVLWPCRALFPFQNFFTLRKMAGELIDAHVSVKQCKLAVQALHAHTAKAAEKKQETELLPGKEQNVWLNVTVKKIASAHKFKPVKIPIVHPIVDPRTSAVCLITKDPQRQYKDLLAEHNIKFISRVVGIEKLKGKFKPFEARRMLLKENGLFLADERIVPLLPKLLGVKWFEAKKQPIPVCLTRKDLKGELERAISSTYMNQNQGTCTARKPASRHPHDNQEHQGGWDNVQSLLLKTNASAGLPVWSCDLGDGEGGRWGGLVANDEETSELNDEEMEDREEEKEEPKKKAKGANGKAVAPSPTAAPEAPSPKTKKRKAGDADADVVAPPPAAAAGSGLKKPKSSAASVAEVVDTPKNKKSKSKSTEEVTKSPAPAADASAKGKKKSAEAPSETTTPSKKKSASKGDMPTPPPPSDAKKPKSKPSDAPTTSPSDAKKVKSKAKDSDKPLAASSLSNDELKQKRVGKAGGDEEGEGSSSSYASDDKAENVAQVHAAYAFDPVEFKPEDGIDQVAQDLIRCLLAKDGRRRPTIG